MFFPPMWVTHLLPKFRYTPWFPHTGKNTLSERCCCWTEAPRHEVKEAGWQSAKPNTPPTRPITPRPFSSTPAHQKGPGIPPVSPVHSKGLHNCSRGGVAHESARSRMEPKPVTPRHPQMAIQPHPQGIVGLTQRIVPPSVRVCVCLAVQWCIQALAPAGGWPEEHFLGVAFPLSSRRRRGALSTGDLTFRSAVIAVPVSEPVPPSALASGNVLMYLRFLYQPHTIRWRC